MNIWRPVYSTGCGWRECPECGPLIELEIEAEHRRVVESTLPERNVLSEWVADLYGTGQERTQENAEARRTRRAEARASRLTARERARVRRVLTSDQRAKALAILEAYPLRKSYLDDAGAKREWMSEAWLELEHPTVKTAAKETRIHLEKRVKLAINRAQHRIKARRRDDNRYVTKDN